MRFIENGPIIPDKLLWARDQGRVVFFCGAGVSMAKAGLPDFLGLLEEVCESLGVISDSDVYKALEQIRKTPKLVNLSVDQLFGLLEVDFSCDDIEKAVAEALKVDNPDLTCHQTLIDLATTPTGSVHIVTTNIDRNFNHCDAGLHSYLPSTLPDVTGKEDFNGIVYLHGQVKEDYSGAEEGGFILSDAELGEAYLNGARATKFVKEILKKYIVVFVGYSADDFPIRYLLRALKQKQGDFQPMYAFHSGTHEEAAAKWKPKGVEVIAYG